MRIVASMVLSTMPMLSVNCVKNVRCVCVKLGQRGQLDDGLDLAFEKHGQHDDDCGCGITQGRSRCGCTHRAASVSSIRRFSKAHCPTRPSPTPITRAAGRVVAVGVAGQQLQLGLAIAVCHLVDDAVLGVDQRRQFGEQHSGRP